MATIQSIKAKIQGLIDKSNEATGGSDTDLTTAIDNLIANQGVSIDNIIQSGYGDIKSNVLNVRDYCFYEQPFDSISMPKCETIGKYVFYGAGSDNLEKIELPECTTISDYAFYGCNAKKIILPKVTTINGSMGSIFRTCLATEIELNSLKSITVSCLFYGAKSLKIVKLPNLKSLMGDSSFYQCKALESIDLSNVTSFYGSRIFYQCTALTSVIFNQTSSFSIPSEMFYGCTALNKIDLQLCVSIGDKAFQGCTNLEAVILRSTSMAQISHSSASYGAFYKLTKCYIYVPTSLVSTYKSNSYWSAYKNYIRAIEDYPDICG